jgi:hypothetical protein
MVVMLTLLEVPVISMEVQEEAVVGLVTVTEVSAAVLRQALVGEAEVDTAVEVAAIAREGAAEAADLFLRPRQRMS